MNANRKDLKPQTGLDGPERSVKLHALNPQRSNQSQMLETSTCRFMGTSSYKGSFKVPLKGSIGIL